MLSTRAALALFALSAIPLFLFTGLNLVETLSPQGCRMSFMSSSYVLQAGFDSSWTPLARRYSLWLYREVGWDTQAANGLPVLFIPGNAGSSHQVRSIASSASRQYYSSPGRVAEQFRLRNSKPLDFYAVEFNEDLTAFHGSTLQSQIEYTSKVIEYILSRYPSKTPLVILGHSMGGIVGTALLPSERISAIITMSTPHTLPPARFDSRIDGIYDKIWNTLANDSTPIVSLCGGATDMMIPSESCILPFESKYRKTVFTSALEGAWTGVGHREMVWCHQVRWRIARAILELGPLDSSNMRSSVLDRWLRDGHTLPSGTSQLTDGESELLLSDKGSYDIIPSNLQLIRKPVGNRVYLLPIPTTGDQTAARLSVLVARGSIPPVSPEIGHSMRTSVYVCSPNRIGNDSIDCKLRSPAALKLIPRPIPGKPFPSPRIDTEPSSGGVDESEGVVLYEADILPEEGQWVGIKVENGQGDGWVIAGLDQNEAITNVMSTISLLWRAVFVKVEAKGSMRLDIHFPQILSNALIVYRLTPRFADGLSCSDSLLSPLVLHTSHPVESHFYPLIPAGNRRILLHTHHHAPYQARLGGDGKGLNFTIYSSGNSGCIDSLYGLDLSLDWSATFGRLSSRYLITLVAWSTGISALMFFLCLRIYNRSASMPTVSQTLQSYETALLRFMLPASLFASLVPWPEQFYLGLGSSGTFAPLAVMVLLIASGLVIVSWWILKLFLWVAKPLATLLVSRQHTGSSVGRSTLISMCIIFALIFLFVPWQVAYLGCWIYQFFICAATQVSAISSDRTVEEYPFLERSEQARNNVNTRPPQGTPRVTERTLIHEDNYRLNLHILLFMTWLLPLVAPVLAVWVRTLLTAGLTTPFDGDHNFMNVAPFLVLIDFASWTTSPIFIQHSLESRVSAIWPLLGVTIVSFLVGGTKPHRIFDMATFSVGLLVFVRIGGRYWGRSS